MLEGQPGGMEAAVGRALAAWMEFVTRHPRRVLGALAVLVLLSAAAATRLGVDADSSRMLSEDLPAQQAAHEINDAFPTLKSSVVIVVQSSSSDTADLAVQSIVRDLREQPEWIERVFSTAEDAFFAAHGLLYRETEEVRTALTRISQSSNLIAKLREDQSIEGFAEALLDATKLAERAEIEADALARLYAETAEVLARAGTDTPRIFSWNAVLEGGPGGPVTRLVTVTPRLDPARLSPASPALQEIARAIAALPPDLAARTKIAVTGEPALRAEEMQSVLGTIFVSLALSLALVAVLLAVGLGGIGRAAVALVSLLASLAVTTGFAALAVGDLNLVSVAFIVLMVGLGIDFAIHILAHIAEMRRAGLEAVAAIVTTGRNIGLALALSALTTCIAFLAFATTDFAGMAQLGAIGAAGVVIAFAVSATLIPGLLVLYPGLAGRRRDTPESGRAFVMPRAAPIAVLVLGAVALVPALQSRFDPDPMGLRDPTAPAVVAFNVLADEHRNSPYRASMLAGSAEEARARADAFADEPLVGAAIWLGTLVPEEQDEKLLLFDISAPSIEFAVSGRPTDLFRPAPTAPPPLEALQKALAGQGGSAGRLNREIAAYRGRRTAETDAALTALLFRAFPLMLGRIEALLQTDFVDAGALPQAMRERFLSPGGIYRVEVIGTEDLRDPARARDFTEAVLAIDAEAGGGPIQLVAAGETVGRSMIQAILLAALATALLAWAATRRLRDTVAIVLPLAVAGVLTAAAGVLLGMPFNYANVIVLPLLIGIGVDSGIHIALGEHRARAGVFSTSTPRAVIFSALTTMAAFGTLALSEHRGTASMGTLLAVAMVAAIGAVLALTPVLIRWARARQTAGTAGGDITTG